MREGEFKAGFPGQLVTLEAGVQAFVPAPLPPPIAWDVELARAVADAQEAVGRLDAAIPASDLDPYLLVYPLMQREAYWSSLIEGTYTTPNQMAIFSQDAPPGLGGETAEDEQTREVFNYINAMENGLTMVRGQGRTTGSGVILELHRRLMHGVRGGASRPGQYRARQNFVGRAGDGIGNARFVPPPPLEVRPLMDGLENYIAAGVGKDAGLPIYLDLALIHYQFETIHPFEDGNGRIGRLMIPLILIEKGTLKEPLLHVSAAVARNKEEYKDRLLGVSQRGEWGEWIRFFLRVVRESADEARRKVGALFDLRSSYIQRVRTPRASPLLGTLIQQLFRRPSTTYNEAKDLLHVTHTQAAIHVRTLARLGVLERTGSNQRNVRYVAPEIVSTIFE